ncbi:transposase [Siminovitchia fordii]|uniref:transposase n=1 Tax=Siminovitchia fordii TaxID=254759 RepID=UPI0035714FCD
MKRKATSNSRVHRVKAIVTFLEHPRLSIVFLPKYSPQLNVVEGLWKRKEDVVNNVFFSKFYHIHKHVTLLWTGVTQGR